MKRPFGSRPEAAGRAGFGQPCMENYYGSFYERLATT